MKLAELAVIDRRLRPTMRVVTSKAVDLAMRCIANLYPMVLLEIFDGLTVLPSRGAAEKGRTILL
jgi:hypothetical protein